jgi:hypothetical protein
MPHRHQEIVWKKVEDRHCLGTSSLGDVWIRLDKSNKTTGMYTMFGSTIKYIPTDDWMLDLVGAQLELDRLYKLDVDARELSKLLRSKQ